MGLAVASSLVLVPVTTASAAEAAPAATTATTAAGGEQISYVVNILPGKLAAALAERAITKAAAPSSRRTTRSASSWCTRPGPTSPRRSARCPACRAPARLAPRRSPPSPPTTWAPRWS
ncbi:hypothetical protein ACFQVA_07350 [Actinomadura keratinilytica]